MKISTKGRYALRVMLDLAEHNTGAYIPLKDIAGRQDLAVKYLEQIIAGLNKAGYLQSLRGNTGGYKLAKSPDQYTVGDILRAAEGSLTPIACLADVPNQCHRRDECQTLPFWEGLNDVIQEYVDGVTLADILNQGKSSVLK